MAIPNKLTLTIQEAEEAARKKTAAFPRRRPRRIGRRRINTPQIRFWDLAQVNHGDPNNPVWEDHPILKSPSFSVTAAGQGPGNNTFAGAVYHFDAFNDSDFAAYTNLFFNYPIIEWKQRYRQIKGIPFTKQGSGDYGFDMRCSPYDATAQGRFLPNFFASEEALGQPTFDNFTQNLLTNYFHFWDNDRSRVKYNNLPFLRGGFRAGQPPGGYLPFHTNDNLNFKITAVNDPDAPAIDFGIPSGVIDIFLMPMVGLYLAVANSADWKTSELLFAYQINPRQHWPRYEEGIIFTGSENGSDAAVNAWFEYQRNRPGIQFSSWTYIGDPPGENVPIDEEFIVIPGTPASWTGLTKWGAAMMSSNNDPNRSYYLIRNRGGPASGDKFPDFSTVAVGSPADDPNFGQDLFRATQPLLTAVIQKGSHFFYVWNINAGFGNLAAFKIQNQNERYKMSRNIAWASSYGGPPAQLKDGTSHFFCL